jgi:hypothetical protein
LLILCQYYFNSIKLQGVVRHNQSNETTLDRVAQHKKVKEWFMNPTKYCREIEAEQWKHSDKCIYHLSTSHSTDECNVKKECKRLLAGKKNAVSAPVPTSSNSPAGHLHNLKEEVFEDAVDEDVVELLPESPSKDTNDADLYYFSRMTNHNLHLVKVSPHLMSASRHNMRYPIIADSGANFHMFKEREFFDTPHPANGRVILGDGKTELSIKGVGTIKCKIGDHTLTVSGVRYVPDLAESIYSLFLHIQCPDHGLHSSFEDGLYIMFPDSRLKLYWVMMTFIWMQFHLIVIIFVQTRLFLRLRFQVVMINFLWIHFAII